MSHRGRSRSVLIGLKARRSRLDEAYRVDPHVLCKGPWGDEAFWFIVTDDGWHGWFIAQYQGALSRERLDEAALLIRRIGTRQSHFFRFECRDDLGLVRGVFRLPTSEPRWEDDGPLAVSMLTDEWGTLLPFLRRIAAGESADAMIAEAKGRSRKSTRGIRRLSCQRC